MLRQRYGGTEVQYAVLDWSDGKYVVSATYIRARAEAFYSFANHSWLAHEIYGNESGGGWDAAYL